MGLLHHAADKDSSPQGRTLDEAPSAICRLCETVASGLAVCMTGFAASLHDAHPLNPGHVLIIPIRHQSDFYALSVVEQAAVWALVVDERDRLAAELGTQSFNVGLNVGRAAGQTVDHAHVHLIPRFPGDVADPRGGIRCVIADRARWWEIS